MKEKNRGAEQQAKKKPQSWFYSTIRDSTLCCFWSILATKVKPTWQSHLCLHFDFKSTRHDSVSMNRTEVFVKFDWRIYRLRKLTPLLTEGKCAITYRNMYYMYISVSISADRVGTSLHVPMHSGKCCLPDSAQQDHTWVSEYISLKASVMWVEMSVAHKMRNLYQWSDLASPLKEGSVWVAWWVGDADSFSPPLASSS